MIRIIASLAFSAAVPAVVLTPVQAGAQQVTTGVPVAQTGARPVSLTPSTALVRPDIAGIRTARSDRDADFHVSGAAAEGLHQGEGVALMAVGGVGLLAGLLIGGNAGSAVAIGGLAVGLVGLYQYIR